MIIFCSVCKNGTAVQVWDNRIENPKAGLSHSKRDTKPAVAYMFGIYLLSVYVINYQRNMYLYIM